MDNKKIEFDKNSSLILKGIAIILMLLHHNFREVSLFENYSVSFYPFSQDVIVSFADMAKICVSLFAFISGYGLYLSCKNNKTTPTKWVATRYIKTFSGYWFIWILSGIITQLIDGRFVYTFLWTNKIDALVNIGIDFLGLANLFASHTLNGTWWYMSTAFIFIIITPLLVKNEEYLNIILLGVVVFLRMIFGGNGEAVFTGGNSAWTFLTPFIIGMIFAKYNLISIITNKKYGVIRFFVEIFLLVVSYFVYIKLDTALYWEIKLGLIPILVVLFVTEFITNIPILKDVLKYLGKHSMNIFMVHTFIRAFYLADFTYSWKHFAIITIVLLVISLAISIVIENIKRIIKFDMRVQNICKKVEMI